MGMPIPLTLQTRPDAVPDLWSDAVQEMRQTSSFLPPDRSILQIFDDTNNALLILGDPGSGNRIFDQEMKKKIVILFYLVGYGRRH